MTREELLSIIREVDPANELYILSDPDISGLFDRINAWEFGSPEKMNVLPQDEKDKAARAKSIAEMLKNDLRHRIARFGDIHLTPGNARIGEGATVNYWSDRHAGTIIKLTKTTITIQRDKATLAPDFKPEYIPGGFSVHCTNSGDQKWIYEPDPKGQIHTLHWSKKV
ncbi:MAG TPA: hypothetical protein DEQ02_00030 [Ruminococcaceae bacterium]|nr:hypothetical protein [Oscillospiraceae bacterium]